jgi:L-seryl-tRNA(Ser) seleniumtransferase
MSVDKQQLKRIPAVDALLALPLLASLHKRFSHSVITGFIREAIDIHRRRFLAGDLPADALEAPQIAEQVLLIVSELESPPLRKVINGTGVMLHTNLGRSPLSAGTQAAVSSILGGYSNLEMDLETGKRTSRLSRVRDLLMRVTGAADAMAVNNNAAAVFLAIQVLAAGREVIVSRGELVEIGGSFRLPDIMAAAGGRLVEVGTTNRTRISDYENAITSDTAMVLKAHPSNFKITGYTEATSSADLARICRDRGVVFFEDLGSGALAQHPAEFLADEPRVQATLAVGAHLVSFSGDKLLGGPQAGILLGDTELIEKLRKNPLARILRLDKLHLAGLEATLLEYLSGERGLDRIPLYRMLRCPVADLRAGGEVLVSTLTAGGHSTWDFSLIETEATVGGGSLPGATVPSLALSIRSKAHSIDRFARFLRTQSPAVMGRLDQDQLILDLRTLLGEEWRQLADLLAEQLNSFDVASKLGSSDQTAEDN